MDASVLDLDIPLKRDDVSAGNAELRKPHEMIVMIPRTQRVTLTGRRLYNVLLQVSQSRLMAAGQMPLADFMFEAPLAALLKTTGSSGEDRTAAKRYLEQMHHCQVDWESTAPGDGLKWKTLSMLSQVEIERRNGENWVRWAFPPDIMTALFSPERWARIDLEVLKHVGSYTALALYEICARYRGSPGGLTSRKSPQWWLDALSQSPAGTEKREWRKFKSERVKAAVEEINAETDLEIELIEHKAGRAVSEVQFAVRRKRDFPSAAAAATLSPVDARLVLRAESLGVRESKLDGLLREFGHELVQQKVAALERRAANPSLRPLDNPYSYLRTLLRESEVPGAPEAAAAPALPAPAGPSEANAFAAASPQAPPSVSASAEWRSSRLASLGTELASMSVADRAPYVEMARQEMMARGLWTAVTSRRAEQGDVFHGAFGAVLVKVFAAERLGADWDRPSVPEMIPGAER